MDKEYDPYGLNSLFDSLQGRDQVLEAYDHNGEKVFIPKSIKQDKTERIVNELNKLSCQIKEVIRGI